MVQVQASVFSPPMFMLQLPQANVEDAGDALFTLASGPAPAPGAAAAAHSTLAADAAARVRLSALLARVPRLPRAAIEFTSEAPAATAALAAVADAAVICRICDESVPRTRMHVLVGAHVLSREPLPAAAPVAAAAAAAAPPPPLPNLVVFCCFCGASDPPCTLAVKRDKLGKYTFVPDGVTCPGAPSLRPSYAVLSRFSGASPCTNVPVYCPACESDSTRTAVFVAQ